MKPVYLQFRVVRKLYACSRPRLPLCTGFTHQCPGSGGHSRRRQPAGSASSSVNESVLHQVQCPDVTTATRVSLVEDEALIRGMLETTLSSDPSVTIVHSASTAQEARLMIAPGSSDVALLDVNLADGSGVSLGLQLQRRDPRLAVMLLSSEDVMGLFSAVQHETTRPWSYLSKRSGFSRDVLVRAVVATARGEVVLDPYLVQRSQPRSGTAVAGLTHAQFQILRLIAEGLSNQAVGERVGINERSVESHLQAVYKHLEVTGDGQNRRVAAVLAFLEQTGRVWRS